MGYDSPFCTYEDYPSIAQQLDDEWKLVRFATWLIRKVKPKTAACYCSLVKSYHKLHTGQAIAPGLTLSRLTKTLQGFSDLLPVAIKDRRVITTSMFTQWKQICHWHSRELINYTTVISVLFCALARACETVPKTQKNFLKYKYKLTRADVEFVPNIHNPVYVKLTKHTAKKRPGSLDAHNKEDPTFLAYDSGAPVNAAYDLQQLFLLDPVPVSEYASTPLFRNHKVGPKVPVTYSQVLTLMKNLASAIGEDPSHYGTHSGRIGGGTALLAAGCPELIIKTLGKWSSEAYRLYTRANIDDTIRWNLALGRQFVDPVQIHRKVAAMTEGPYEGSASWIPNLHDNLHTNLSESDSD